MKDFNDQIWAYLHDELTSEDRERFEMALLADATLRANMEECREMHQQLELLGDEYLEDELLTEWEAAHPEHRERRTIPRSRVIRFAIPLAAAAAAMFVLMILPSKDPVQWQRTVYGSAPQLRGSIGQQPRYGKTELRRASQTLQHAIDSNIDTFASPPPTWKLKIQMQEMANGYLAVEVSGHPLDHKETTVAWDDTFRSLEHFDAEAAVFAKRIADDLVKRNPQ